MKHIFIALALLLIPVLAYFYSIVNPDDSFGIGFLVIGILFFFTPFAIGYLVFALVFYFWQFLQKNTLSGPDTQLPDQATTVVESSNYLFWLTSAIAAYLILSLLTGGEFLPNPIDFLFGGNWFASGLVTFVIIGALLPASIKLWKKN